MYGSLALRSNQASKLVTKHSNELNPEGLSGKQLRFETFFLIDFFEMKGR